MCGMDGLNCALGAAVGTSGAARCAPLAVRRSLPLLRPAHHSQTHQLSTRATSAQVNMARVYNYDIKARRIAKQAALGGGAAAGAVAVT